MTGEQVQLAEEPVLAVRRDDGFPGVVAADDLGLAFEDDEEVGGGVAGAVEHVAGRDLADLADGLRARRAVARRASPTRTVDWSFSLISVITIVGRPTSRPSTIVVALDASADYEPGDTDGRAHAAGSGCSGGPSTEQYTLRALRRAAHVRAETDEARAGDAAAATTRR